MLEIAFIFIIIAIDHQAPFQNFQQLFLLFFFAQTLLKIPFPSFFPNSAAKLIFILDITSQNLVH